MIWRDVGTGGSTDLATYRLKPAPNYKCLGDAIMDRHESPDLNKYRCVLTEYLVDKKYKSVIWDARGTGK